ncbi:hypothetical protein HYALB_00012327 [Hymenoscyphus albidus]|uniref:Uncharacterized protein n=1 Tax=Hymenoscyphus albidus TaxID=595503 RepID=A0A9N9LLP9_9HELO|nr:hypothetical protein HYALB_00012327 [Hymenoscyphus albidus]
MACWPRRRCMISKEEMMTIGEDSSVVYPMSKLISFSGRGRDISNGDVASDESLVEIESSRASELVSKVSSDKFWLVDDLASGRTMALQNNQVPFSYDSLEDIQSAASSTVLAINAF